MNIVTKTLFKKYKSAKAYATVPPEELEKDIQSTGFYRNKAKSLRAMAASLVEKHGGKVPQTMDELTAPAPASAARPPTSSSATRSARTSASPSTRTSTRLSERLGLTKHTDAVKIEQDLMQIVPQEEWTLWSHLLIHHGRAICQARKPKCPECPLLPHCPAGQKLVKAVVVRSPTLARAKVVQVIDHGSAGGQWIAALVEVEDHRPRGHACRFPAARLGYRPRSALAVVQIISEPP